MTIAEISELVGLIATGIGLIVSIVGWVKTRIKNIKEKKLKAKVEELMIFAEKTGMSGKEKKQYVLMSIIGYLEELGGDVNKMKNQASDYIEELINFSKKINAKDKN